MNRPDCAKQPGPPSHLALSITKSPSPCKPFYESGVRMKGMRGELALQPMPLHPNEQQNEHVGDTNECEWHRNANLLQRRESTKCEATRPLSHFLLPNPFQIAGNLRFIALHGWLVKFRSHHFVGQVLLLHEMFGVIMGILIGKPMSQLCGPAVMGVL